jgi:hypothetical protein
MDAGSEELLRDKLDAINSKFSSKTKVNYKGKILCSERGKNV